MKDTKFTPGPWAAIKCTCGDPICNWYKISVAGSVGMFSKEDAYLIAAAPELYEALSVINNWLVCAAITTPDDMAQSFSTMQELAESTLKKARGEA